MDRSAPLSSAERRRVQRRTRFVSWLKIGLPLTGLALIVALFLSARDRGDVADLLTPEQLTRLAAGMRLENPRLAGVTNKGEPFTIRADWVLPESAVLKRLKVGRPVGEITLADARRVRLVADEGFFDRAARRLRFEGDVRIEVSGGSTLETERLEIDLAGDTARAPGPVRVASPRGRLEAGSMRAAGGPHGTADGKIWFENGVRVVFIPADTAPADPASGHLQGGPDDTR